MKQDLINQNITLRTWCIVMVFNQCHPENLSELEMVNPLHILFKINGHTSGFRQMKVVTSSLNSSITGPNNSLLRWEENSSILG